MSIIWEAPITPPSLKLTALALADWSNDEGGSLHPSISTVAKKVCISRCQAQRLIQDLKALGFLSVLSNANGGSHSTTPRYHLHLDRIAAMKAQQGMTTGSAHATRSARDTGGADEAPGVAPMHRTGSAHATQTTIEPPSTPVTSSSASKPAQLPCPHERIKEIYAELLPDLPAVKIWNARRQAALKARWSEMTRSKSWSTVDDGLTWFGKFFEAVASSDFLMGRAERGHGHEAWRCDFDFLVSPKGFVGVIEGKYANRGAA
jgi:hypothetical protein